MFLFIRTPWQTALQVKSFRLKCLISGLLLALCAIAAPSIFQFIQHREGSVLNDYILNNLPILPLSVWIFTLLYLLIFSAVASLITKPHQFLLTIQAYIILTIFRFITLLLVPLNPPEGILELNDPLVQHFFYQQSITKDLFFSGHTSLLVLLALSVPFIRLRFTLFIGALLVAVMLLLQHVHYTIDIMMAPLFSWLAFTLAKKLP